MLEKCFAAVKAISQRPMCLSGSPCLQVWALQQGGALHVAGRTNRAKVAFAEELEAAYQAVPETLPRGADAAGPSLSGNMPRSSSGERDATAALAGERA